uniref:uncharacterized protein n=1 Tax=Lonchura striata TaxID=40157 RepID=UPI001293D1FE|nr:uncharacterized protein LOC110471412 [Lonchura striata domestica]
MRWDGMGAERPPQAGLRERERLPGRRHHGNALPPWRGEPFASPPPRSYSAAVPILGKRGGTGRTPQTAALPAARGASGGDGAGAAPRLPRQQTPASRQKVRW